MRHFSAILYLYFRHLKLEGRPTVQSSVISVIMVWVARLPDVEEYMYVQFKTIMPKEISFFTCYQPIGKLKRLYNMYHVFPLFE